MCPGNHGLTQIAEITDVMKRQSECIKINLTLCCCAIDKCAMSELPKQHPNRDEIDNVENELAIFLFVGTGLSDVPGSLSKATLDADNNIILVSAFR